MEWVETTGKSLDDAREAALDRLGVGADEAEFEVLEQPKPGLFGRTRGQARLRARVLPTPARPKQERRRRSKSDGKSGNRSRSKKSGSVKASPSSSGEQASDNGSAADVASGNAGADSAASDTVEGGAEKQSQRSNRGRSNRGRTSSTNNQEKPMSNERPESNVTPEEVGDAAVSFMNDLVSAFGATGEAQLSIDGSELEVRVVGDDLGLLVGPGGRTLNAVQDLVRVSAQRRLGDHETRLRIDVAGYRERRTAALGKFAADVAAQVRESGTARSLEPMPSADRKVIHDALNEEDGVVSRSAGEDPQRRVIVEPAGD